MGVTHIVDLDGHRHQGGKESAGDLNDGIGGRVAAARTEQPEEVLPRVALQLSGDDGVEVVPVLGHLLFRHILLLGGFLLRRSSGDGLFTQDGLGVGGKVGPG